MDMLYALVGRWIGTRPARYNANANGKDALTPMIVLLVMYRAWLGLKALAWAWLWWAWALEILSQAQIQGLPKPEAWLGLKPGLIYHI